MRRSGLRLRRSTLAVLLAFTLCLSSNGCIGYLFAAREQRGSQDYSDLIGTVVGIGVMVAGAAAISHFSGPPPCRQAQEDDEKMTALEWRALADCQEGRGDHEKAKATRALALQLENAGASYPRLTPTARPAR